MRKYIFKPRIEIPKNRLEDVTKLRNFIMKEMNIDISMIDTFQLWLEISDDHCAGWLDINYCYDKLEREEFLLDYMREYGIIVEEEDN